MSKPENSKGSWADRVGNEIQYMARQVSRGRWPYSAPYTPGMLTLPHGQGVRFRKSDGSYRHPTSAEMANFRANEWGRGMGLSVNNGQLNITRPGLLPPVPAASQPAPGSTVPTLTVGTSNSNRRAEANRMSQQGGGGSTQSRPTAAQPTSRSAHAGGWTPETQGAAYAAGKAMEDDRLSNQAAGLPALWGDVRPDSDPRSESYWQRADMQQWASANLELANRSRSRYNLPPLERGADGKVIVSGGTVSPYANAFSAPAPAELRGRSVQDLYGQQRDPLVDYRSGVSVTPEQFAGGDAAPAAAYSAPMMSTSFNRQQGAQPVNPANVPVAQAFGGNASLAPAGFESSVQVDPSTWSRGADQAADAYDAELDPSNEFLKRFRARAK